MKVKGTLASSLIVAAVIFGDISMAHAFALNSRNVPQSTSSDVQLINTTSRKTVPEKYQRKVVRLKTNEAPGTIIVDTNNKFLYYVEGKGRATRYGIGVGREGFGWSGVVNVGRKAEWPSWTPPEEMRRREAKKGIILPVVQKGGPDNPLGARALYLYQGKRDTIFRIHGTNQPWTIGQNMSSGCIRMMNKDVEHLYSRADIGSKVIVVGPGGKEGNVAFKDNGIDILRAIFGG